MSTPAGNATAALPPPLTTEELDQTFGVLFIGFVVSTVLYGLTFFQTYIYFSRYPKDNVWTKSTVGLLSLLDTATSALMSQALYYYLITMFASPLGLLDATSTFCAENGLAILVAFLVQIFFAIRVWTVSNKNWALAGAIAFFAVAAFAFGITMTVQIFNQKRLSELATTHMKVVAALSQGLATLADIMITGALMWYLSPSRNVLMKGKTPNGWFEKLCTYVINRGTCVAVIQLAYLLAFVIVPAKQIWMPFHLVVSKVYVNTLLAMLNSREITSGRGAYEEESVSTTTSQPKLSFGRGVTSDTGISRSVRFNMDTMQSADGEHNIELDKLDSQGAVKFEDDPVFDIAGRDHAKSPLDIKVTQETFTA
ncbi:hypothetical protein GLOTRDRAFT_139097 [Gloeophyllum trabeum ATCC 11539]|uniref:DUF6534 domain-containing protein n=1 Tax=Gloeophyllum trabeum (strain ATCC 11539 / FP-39264 / Madison 617) TaxID=670483 RepID=S7Q4U7_GLOTA|nr:uncharacterized protein GLOTRDRAFT_139097 [Gloeophyllum trabeum ATCC 11539]EPQ54522.1 hypothetical protein GLOTRDRAFT_139097 [Gloeophyllum trabeum ATCC 11539]